jgi:hypothetical protein
MEPTSEQDSRSFLKKAKSRMKNTAAFKSHSSKTEAAAACRETAAGRCPHRVRQSGFNLVYLSVILPLIPISFAVISRLLHIMVLIKLTLLLVPLILFGCCVLCWPLFSASSALNRLPQNCCHRRVVFGCDCGCRPCTAVLCFL